MHYANSAFSFLTGIFCQFFYDGPILSNFGGYSIHEAIHRLSGGSARQAAKIPRSVHSNEAGKSNQEELS